MNNDTSTHSEILFTDMNNGINHTIDSLTSWKGHGSLRIENSKTREEKRITNRIFTLYQSIKIKIRIHLNDDKR